MALIKAEYYRLNGSVWDKYYFKTSADMVEGLSGAQGAIGTLNKGIIDINGLSKVSDGKYITRQIGNARVTYDVNTGEIEGSGTATFAWQTLIDIQLPMGTYYFKTIDNSGASVSVEIRGTATSYHTNNGLSGGVLLSNKNRFLVIAPNGSATLNFKFKLLISQDKQIDNYQIPLSPTQIDTLLKLPNI